MLKLSTRFRWLGLLPVASFAIHACSGSDPDQGGAPSGYEDVLLEGEVTDETLEAFAEKLASSSLVEDELQAPVIDWPGQGDKLPKDTPSSFCWRFGPAAHLDHAPGDHAWAALDPRPARTASTWARPLLDLLGPPRSALAHGEPFNGIATYLVFSTASNPKLLRVLTSAEEFTPSKEAWGEMAAVGKPIKLSLVAAVFEENRVPQDGGPFAGIGITFTVE